MALRMASTDTPTSANTAIHMLPRPSALRISTMNFTPSAKAMFWCTMVRVRLEMRMAVAIFCGLSSMSTTSAASMAASEPSAPMAMPTSARESTGASLMPSPTKASFSPFCWVTSSFSTCATLSAGSSSLYTPSTPSSRATASATSFRSPVSITLCFTPQSFSA